MTKKSRMPLVEPPKSKTVEKLFKISQNEPIIFYFFGWAARPLYGDSDVSKTKNLTKLF